MFEVVREGNTVDIFYDHPSSQESYHIATISDSACSIFDDRGIVTIEHYYATDKSYFRLYDGDVSVYITKPLISDYVRNLLFVGSDIGDDNLRICEELLAISNLLDSKYEYALLQTFTLRDERSNTRSELAEFISIDYKKRMIDIHELSLYVENINMFSVDDILSKRVIDNLITDFLNCMNC